MKKRKALGTRLLIEMLETERRKVLLKIVHKLKEGMRNCLAPFINKKLHGDTRRLLFVAWSRIARETVKSEVKHSFMYG